VAAAVFCLAVVALVGAVVIYPQASARYHWRQARAALSRHDLDEARDHLRRCLEVWKNSGEAHFLMARTCRRADDADAARDHLQRARQLGWDRDAVERELLLAQAQAGLLPRVEGALRQDLEAGTDEGTVILEALARGCLQANLVDRAYGYTGLWVERYPDDWVGRFWHARALEQGLRLDLAAEAYRQVLARRPDHAESHLRRGHILLARGRYAEALPHLETYLARHPDDEGALVDLARCQRAARPAGEARATVERLLALPGEHPGGWLLCGQLDLDDDRPDDALPWLERAARALPHDRDVHVQMAAVLRRLGRDDEARKHEERMLAIDRDQQRVEALTKEILARPRDVGLRYEAGVTLVRLGQDAQAVRWFVSVLLLEPGHQPTRQALAECIRRRNDPQLEAAYRPVLLGER
jgi:tetratricopeptide (TPR) repeat protein